MNRDHCNRFSSIVSLYFFFLVSFDLHILASSTLQNCRHDQRDFLMELKDEFSTNDTSLSSWTNETDCCSWEGVTCNAKSGQVISLDLNFNVLNNSLKQNSALFKFQQLRVLNLGDCNLFGKLPSSLGNLSRLIELDLSYNQFVGEVPSSVGNLNQLSHMRLDGNNFTGNIPISFANFTNLSQLDISHNQFIGNFPLVILPNLTSLSSLHISSNHFDSSLPSDMTTLHNLESFNADENSISGDFPSSLFMIPSLTMVTLEGNQLKGHIAFSNTTSSSKLRFLHLARNKLEGPILDSISNFLNLEVIDLSHNDFTGPIPLSISKLVNLNLTYLGLSNNKLEGEIPNFLWGLEEVTLSHNFFSSFGESSHVPNETLILALDLSSNSLQGPFPEWICKLGPLRLLDLSNNLLNGSIPRCLNFTSYLNELILHNNSLTGVVPDIFSSATGLRTLDVSRNQLQGKIPKSLINCKAMEFLNVERNRIKDEFPSWLGSLPSLHVLFLRSNQFYGPLYHPHLSVVGFQNLSVIDISDNDFNGTLPPYYFSSWSQMRTITIEVEDDITYLGKEIHGMYSMIGYKNSMEMVNKGVETEFERIRKDFRAIDFSGNRFCGKIPESIGLLKELRYLNLSGNAFTGNILSSLANITNLETLDLSRNKLSGHIPSELGNLSFLSNINFSHNNLQGPVPRGTQFQSQKCSSFMDNPKLYGLEDICGDAHVPNPTSQQSEELSEPEEQVFSWIAAAIAYGPGVFCGLVLGHIFASQKHQWFTEKFH